MIEEIVSDNLKNGEKSWIFLDGSKRTEVTLRSAVIGRGDYSPGWRWSEHVAKQTGKSSQAHIGYIISGRMVVRTRGPIEWSRVSVAQLVEPGEKGFVVKDYSKRELEAGRPKFDAMHCIKHALEALYSDDVHEVSDLVSPGLTYEEIIGTLLVARDRVEELLAIDQEQ